jgi:hypothetical protein
MNYTYYVKEAYIDEQCFNSLADYFSSKCVESESLLRFFHKIRMAEQSFTRQHLSFGQRWNNYTLSVRIRFLLYFT